jgi:hypothetical protein
MNKFECQAHAKNTVIVSQTDSSDLFGILDIITTHDNAQRTLLHGRYCREEKRVIKFDLNTTLVSQLALFKGLHASENGKRKKKKRYGTLQRDMRIQKGWD